VSSYLHSILLVILFGSLLNAQQMPPVPSDPLELVPANAQPVQSVNQRAEIIKGSNEITFPY